jgi:hypothetical protein
VKASEETAVIAEDGGPEVSAHGVVGDSRGGEAEGSEGGLCVEGVDVLGGEGAAGLVALDHGAGEVRAELVAVAPGEEGDGEVEDQRLLGGALEIKDRGELVAAPEDVIAEEISVAEAPVGEGRASAFGVAKPGAELGGHGSQGRIRGPGDGVAAGEEIRDAEAAWSRGR